MDNEGDMRKREEKAEGADGKESGGKRTGKESTQGKTDYSG